MAEALQITEHPEADEVYMIAGWRQWADAGSISSGLPHYLVQRTNARRIGSIKPDGFYLFQIPGTHDLVRPVVRFDEGYPESLESRRNELFYSEINHRGIVIFLGDEPHLDVERYVAAILDAAEALNVKRIIGLGGVYGELPYNKERTISSNYSLRSLKAELDEYAVSFSDYHGGASIGSYMSRRAGDRDMQYIGLYAFVPTYDFSSIAQIGKTIRIENDYMAWLGVMRRINYMLKLGFDLADLEDKSQELLKVLDSKVDELDSAAAQADVREYFTRLSEEFTESVFEPLDSLWENELRRLFDDSESGPT